MSCPMPAVTRRNHDGDRLRIADDNRVFDEELDGCAQVSIDGESRQIDLRFIEERKNKSAQLHESAKCFSLSKRSESLQRMR